MSESDHHRFGGFVAKASIQVEYHHFAFFHMNLPCLFRTGCCRGVTSSMIDFGVTCLRYECGFCPGETNTELGWHLSVANITFYSAFQPSVVTETSNHHSRRPLPCLPHWEMGRVMVAISDRVQGEYHYAFFQVSYYH
jgi:hypothetical protein